MRGRPFEAPPPFTSWGLVLDGDVWHDALTNGTCSTTQQRSVRRPTRLPSRGGPVASIAAAVAVREADSSSGGRTDIDRGAVLDDWERSAVDLYREIRRHRREGAKRSRNGASMRDSAPAGSRLDASDAALPSPYSALMGTAFPHLLGGPLAPPGPVPPNLAYDCPAAPPLPWSAPLLLHFFLAIGYPMRLPCSAETASASYSAALVAAAQETVAWFENSSAAVADTALSKIAGPVHRFGAHLLSDVAQQMVAAYRMTPATAAAWLLRVYVGLMAPHAAKEYDIQGSIAADHGFESSLPDPGLPPVFCMEGIWHWAYAMCAAVYHLQTSTRAARETSLHASEKSSESTVRDRPGEKTVPQQPMQALADDHFSSNVGWRLFALTVLQQTTTLILRGCFNTASGSATNASEDPTGSESWEKNAARAERKEDAVGTQSWSPVASETVLPAVPTSRVVVEGLACFALLVRLHERFPTQRELRHDTRCVHARAEAGHVAEAAQAMVEKHWEGHAQLAVRQLPHLPPHYHHLVHMMDFVLTG
ncbi:hypothetical protein GH5_03770 [Leishmania sp. Ghana 2012 LV757]|uniref:hypothetical protein n=1 Tax=Leishmania sp. Ghana 2012 LV757 TaxID=2803181 RepID=UPI001B43B032|nr:hypothetical protein GH5_03770 [Leishmania sp. Ghana 2012 LV757]